MYQEICNTTYEDILDIVSEFCLLNPVSKEDVAEWLTTNFPNCDAKRYLLSSLSNNDVKIEDKFYHKDEENVIFYFQLYNMRTRRSFTKRISIRMPKMRSA
jgi:hypothetical protein